MYQDSWETGPQTITEEMDPFHEPESYREDSVDIDITGSGNQVSVGDGKILQKQEHHKVDVCQVVGVAFLIIFPVIAAVLGICAIAKML